MEIIAYCADIGSIRQGNFGWARSECGGEVERHRGGSEILELVEAVTPDLAAGHAVALGFERPLFARVPVAPFQLGAARPGEANRPGSGGAGSGVLATGLVQAAWILRELRRRLPEASAYVSWDEFAQAGRGLLLWEAFVSDRAKATTHVDDATLAV